MVSGPSARAAWSGEKATSLGSHSRTRSPNSRPLPAPIACHARKCCAAHLERRSIMIYAQSR
jgi:hypothetical protein